MVKNRSVQLIMKRIIKVERTQLKKVNYELELRKQALGRG